jgi:hypothetical protein
MIENSEYNKAWQENRINLILSLYDKSFFKGKKILELGAFHGDIGNYFSTLGAEVTCNEGLRSNYVTMRNKYPNVKSINSDLDTPNWDFGKFDIIINFGLYYHLENHHEEHLKNCLNNCDLLFFESVILDSDDSKIHYREESGIDQSLSEVGGTPTAKYVENLFGNFDVDYKRYDVARLDSSPHSYSWVETNSGIFDGYKRRFWIVSKK